MPLHYAELEKFYEGLVVKLRERGVTCAITSGMACVHYGVAQTTKDCDMLCVPEAADRCLSLLAETSLGGGLPSYRGKLSPPLDARWMRGGWTSHFFWQTGDMEAYLDVFGQAPRGSTVWESELCDLYANPHTVAEMKRTNRDKDWPFATALGVNLLDAGDMRGWLHIFNEEALLDLLERVVCPPEMVRLRPSLQLALNRDARLKPALRVEREFWYELDRARMHVYNQAVRPYLVAVRKAQIPDEAKLLEQHKVRVECAEKHLSIHPIKDYGIVTLVNDAKAEIVKLGATEYMQWLPNVETNFRFLAQ